MLSPPYPILPGNTHRGRDLGKLCVAPANVLQLQRGLRLHSLVHTVGGQRGGHQAEGVVGGHRESSPPSGDGSLMTSRAEFGMEQWGHIAEKK